MPQDVGRARTAIRTYGRLLAVVMCLLGAILALGGAWLAVLGGSWYYVFAGCGLIASGLYLYRGSLAGIWLYALTFLITIVWAVLERGLDPWPQVPRLLAPVIVVVLIGLAVPSLRRRRHEGAGVTGAALLVLGLAVVAQTWMQGATLSAQTPAAPAQDPAAEPAETNPQPPQPDTGRPAAVQRETGADWPAYGGTHAAQRFSPLDQITPANVADLELAWEFRTGDMPTEAAEGRYSPENTPLKVDDTIFVCSAMGIVIGVDAATGREEWRFDPQVSTDAIPYGATCRGVAYYQASDAAPDDVCATRILWGTLDARLLAVDAVTGLPCPEFGDGGTVDLEQGIGDTVPGWYSVTSAPTIVRGVAVMGAQVKDGQAENAPSGVVRGYDAVTGDLVWAWDLGDPSLTGLPAEGATYTRGTPNMWTTASGDEELGLVYLPLGNSSVDYYGSNRSDAENTYATSLVALDVATGQPAWHLQTVYRDVWDYDLGGQATLVDYPGPEGVVPALVLPSKQGDIYLLDRRTGTPLFPVEDRDVPQGGVEPDYLSPAQPFSTYHTLAKQRLEERDMWGFTPVDQLWCRIQFRQAAYDGIYTPPTSDQKWIQYPGYNGGSDWGGVAVDPTRGIIVANDNDMPNHNRLIPRAEADAAGLRPITEAGGTEETPLGEAGPQTGAPYAIQVNAGWRVPFTGLLCKQPPYGGIRAIDLGTGETLWDRPFGTARNNGPFGIPSRLPFDIGTPNNGGAVLTAGGLIFIAAATDDLFRAIDISTGETVWQTALPAGGQSNPFMFEQDGRQFVGLMAGGHHFMETPIGDHVLVWALPE
ncbi:MAG: membrane-bound PQQ-dependent dehydrogenase, glucose/quinate/shikimate family [Pseudomonadota bacterium]